MKTLIKFWVCVSALFAFVHHANGAVAINICTTAYENSNGLAEISFTIENTSSQSFRFLRDELPGAFPYSIYIFLLKDNGEIIRPRLPVIGMNPDKVVTLHPGEKQETKLVLKERFPEIEKTRKRDELSVFWSYRPETILDKNFIRQPRIGGWLQIKRSQEDECR